MSRNVSNGPLTRYVTLRVAHAPGMLGTFSLAADSKGNRLLAIPACITARAVMHVGIACLRWRGKRYLHSRRMRTRNFPYLARGTFKKSLDLVAGCGHALGCPRRGYWWSHDHGAVYAGNCHVSSSFHWTKFYCKFSYLSEVAAHKCCSLYGNGSSHFFLLTF